MNDSKNDISADLHQVFRMFIGAKDIFLYTEYFHNPYTEEEKSLVFKSSCSNHLQHIMHYMFRSLIVELAKLLSSSKYDKYSILNLLNKLRTDNNFVPNKISKEELFALELQVKRIKKYRNRVVNLRNKIYAHSDPLNFNEKENEITFKEIKEILETIESVLTYLFKSILDSGIISRSPSFDRQRFSLLQKLAVGERVFQENIKNKWLDVINQNSQHNRF